MEAATDLQNIPGWSSNRIESYRISRYWRHIVSYPYHENYRSNKFDIPHYSSKSRSRQQNARIANQYRRHQQRERRARSN